MTKTTVERIECLQYYCDEINIPCARCVFDYPGTLVCKLSAIDITNESEVNKLYNKLPKEYK